MERLEANIIAYERASSLLWEMLVIDSSTQARGEGNTIKDKLNMVMTKLEEVMLSKRTQRGENDVGL